MSEKVESEKCFSCVNILEQAVETVSLSGRHTVLAKVVFEARKMSAF
jgi:hypothetical protein